MNEEQLNALIKYIDVLIDYKIDVELRRDTSMSWINESDLKKEVYTAFEITSND